MGFKIRLCNEPAGNAERNNNKKTGKDEAEPVYQDCFKASGIRGAIENYYGK